MDGGNVIGRRILCGIMEGGLCFERWGAAVQPLIVHVGCCSGMVMGVVAALLHRGMQVVPTSVLGLSWV